MTNSPSFCSSCHEMAPEYSTYTASAHSQISCVQCHIKPGVVNMLTHKMKSVKEVILSLYDGCQIKLSKHEEEAVSNQNCLQCHSTNRLVTASNDLKVDHKKHIDEGIPCITCHSGVVHAKMAARELNVGDDRANWTNSKNAQKMIEEKYLRPNMGTCIDCHDKVNKGEKPWKDAAYNVPANPEEKGKENSTEKTSPKETQQVILEGINSNTSKLKVSMACNSCHQDMGIPKDHQTADFTNNHTTAAVDHLDQCLNCHQDSKWTKDISKQDIMTLLKYGDSSNKPMTKYVPSLDTAKAEAKNNTFCNTCHEKNNRPSQPSS